MVKPLFVPLKAVYYHQFEVGLKTFELRRGSDKRWSAKHCYEGRAATLSRGYGKQHRLSAIVDSHQYFEVWMLNAKDRKDFRECFGDDEKFVNIIGFRDISPS